MTGTACLPNVLSPGLFTVRGFLQTVPPTIEWRSTLGTAMIHHGNCSVFLSPPVDSKREVEDLELYDGVVCIEVNSIGLHMLLINTYIEIKGTARRVVD